MMLLVRFCTGVDADRYRNSDIDSVRAGGRLVPQKLSALSRPGHLSSHHGLPEWNFTEFLKIS